MDEKTNDDVKPVAAKSIDPAALEMLAHAEGCGLDTASRADAMKPCPIGESGACCRICSMGPCRLVGKDAEEKTGICGADMGTDRLASLRPPGRRQASAPTPTTAATWR